MNHFGPWRLQEENLGHGMGIESPASAEKGDSIVWTGSDCDLRFADDVVKRLVVGAGESAQLLEQILVLFEIGDFTVDSEGGRQLLLGARRHLDFIRTGKRKEVPAVAISAPPVSYRCKHGYVVLDCHLPCGYCGHSCHHGEECDHDDCSCRGG